MFQKPNDCVSRTRPRKFGAEGENWSFHPSFRRRGTVVAWLEWRRWWRRDRICWWVSALGKKKRGRKVWFEYKGRSTLLSSEGLNTILLSALPILDSSSTFLHLHLQQKSEQVCHLNTTCLPTTFHYSILLLEVDIVHPITRMHARLQINFSNYVFWMLTSSFQTVQHISEPRISRLQLQNQQHLPSSPLSSELENINNIKNTRNQSQWYYSLVQSPASHLFLNQLLALLSPSQLVHPFTQLQGPQEQPRNRAFWLVGLCLCNNTPLRAALATTLEASERWRENVKRSRFF